jgi:hypothetical protein
MQHPRIGREVHDAPAPREGVALAVVQQREEPGSVRGIHGRAELIRRRIAP